MIAALALFAATASATHCAMIQTLPGDPVQPSPGWQKVVCSRVIDPSELAPEDRLQTICDMTDDADADLRAQRQQNKKLREDLKDIRTWACGSAKPK